jgi:hypothetical protein
MNDNVIKFPSKKPEKEASASEEEIFAFVETLWVNLLEDMRKAGYDFGKDTEKYFPSMVLVFESMRSLASIEKGIDHPLQTISEELFSFKALEDEDERSEMTIEELFIVIENISKETVDS